ncbi:Tyrosine-protein phosphatase [Penicillium subrubescens]|uniref:Tyrosine-protein phosphatase n=2 Tax=Penicillium subrubescens TaxID=1316194 RepID=A0A1Q5T169_9EURO|nr:Tyrosine-protein phosphatase [Penicillium subrubescens]
MATRKRRAEIASAGSPADVDDIDLTSAPVPADPDEHICKIPDSQRLFISLTGKAFERALLSKLDWFSYLRVITLALTGYRPDAIRLIGETIMQPRGLTGLAQDTLETSIPEFRSIFTTLATDTSYPILIHCTQGKDRTGIIILLALLLAGVRMDAVADDYARSELELVPEFEERMREIRVLGLGEEYTRCPPDYVPDMIGFLERRYGGVRGYLERIGIDAGMQDLIRQKLLVQG